MSEEKMKIDEVKTGEVQKYKMKEYLDKLFDGKNLSYNESCELMGSIMEGYASDCQIAAMLAALRMKGETVDEISGFAVAMLEKAEKVKSIHCNLVDTCGTGGDGLNTFNISTAAALTAAGAGVVIAKHGNRSASSRCGSADVLEALGVNIELECGKVSECIDSIGIGFIFAPIAHKAMRHVAKARKNLGIRTVFNILGPITNPAGANGRVLGISDMGLMDIIINSLKSVGVRRAFVVSSFDGMDEFSVTSLSAVSELRDGKINKYTFDPQKYGFKKSEISKISGGDPEFNAKIITDILSGNEMGARRDAVLLNSAAAIVVGGKADNLKVGIAIAAESLDSGSALNKLNQLIAFTNNIK